MYQIRLVENGQFVTVIGGQLKTLSEAIKQIETLCHSTNAELLEDYLGCRWTRGSSTLCYLLVCDRLGWPIKAVKEE